MSLFLQSTFFERDTFFINLFWPWVRNYFMAYTPRSHQHMERIEMNLTSNTLFKKLPSQKLNMWILWFQLSCISSSWQLQSLRSIDSINRYAVSIATVLMWSLNALVWKKRWQNICENFCNSSQCEILQVFKTDFLLYLTPIPTGFFYSCFKNFRNLLLNLYKNFSYFSKVFK